MLYVASMNDARAPSDNNIEDESVRVMCRVCDYRFRIDRALGLQLDGRQVACPSCGQKHQLFVYWFDHSIAIGIKAVYHS